MDQVRVAEFEKNLDGNLADLLDRLKSKRSCKTRYFCPSCQAKRVAAFVEWATEEVLEEVVHPKNRI
ncbi:transposase zinc-binding domain-containing protein [Acidobacteria bacterium AH-259-G07]|nr:transposase zinc-binding domain-containing protein [Acidobacteria bacterium AH-259-G07]